MPLHTWIWWFFNSCQMSITSYLKISFLYIGEIQGEIVVRIYGGLIMLYRQCIDTGNWFLPKIVSDMKFEDSCCVILRYDTIRSGRWVPRFWIVETEAVYSSEMMVMNTTWLRRQAWALWLKDSQPFSQEQEKDTIIYYTVYNPTTCRCNHK
jgi:hypothetical protein